MPERTEQHNMDAHGNYFITKRGTTAMMLAAAKCISNPAWADVILRIG